MKTGAGRGALQCNFQKINLHQVGAEPFTHANHPTAGSGDICLVFDGDLDSIIGHINRCDPTHFLGLVNYFYTTINTYSAITHVNEKIACKYLAT